MASEQKQLSLANEENEKLLDIQSQAETALNGALEEVFDLKARVDEYQEEIELRTERYASVVLTLSQRYLLTFVSEAYVEKQLAESTKDCECFAAELDHVNQQLELARKEGNAQSLELERLTKVGEEKSLELKQIHELWEEETLRAKQQQEDFLRSLAEREALYVFKQLKTHPSALSHVKQRAGTTL